MHHQLRRLQILALAIFGGLVQPSAASAASGAWVPQTYVHGPADNPLKGFLPYQGSYSTFPHSMEFNYIAWKDIHTAPTTYNWAPIDNLLNDVASRGHQTVFRIYADYPTLPYGVPGFLSGVAKNAYTDYGNTTSFSPNYDDPNLLSAMQNVIAALGARYDGDPRIAYVTVGFIGFWGEWHTYRDSCACDTWMPSANTQSAVLTAFDNAFNRTKVLLRQPRANAAGLNIGYHDDSFNYSTYGSTAWYFWPTMIAAGLQNKWQTEPIGGEIYPPIQLTIWNNASLCVTGGAGDQQCYNTSVDTTHASWMLTHALFSIGNSGTPHSLAIAGAERLGYDLFVSSVALPDTTTTGSLSVSIRMQDRGIAPFYYPWTVQIAAANSANQVVATWNTSWDLRTVLDAADRQFDFTTSHALPAGTYKLVMRAVNPLANGKPLRFANQKWGQDVANWLTLDTVVVSATARPTATATARPTATSRPTATATTRPRATATATATARATATATSGTGCAIGAVCEAETALRGGSVTVSTLHAGYTGSGFADYQGSGTGFVEWTVNVPAAGTYNLNIRYANGGTGDRPMAIAVNGTTVVSSLSFPVTGWTSWTVRTQSVSLPAGTVRIRATELPNGPNVDHLTVTGGSATATATARPRATATATARPTATATALPTSVFYTLFARHSGKVTDVSGASTAEGAAIVQMTSNGAISQQWSFTDMGSGYYRLANRNSGRCLDVNGASTTDGAQILQRSCGSGLNQQWQMVDQGSGYFHLIARHSGKCADVAVASTADGAQILQWACGQGLHQHWRR